MTQAELKHLYNTNEDFKGYVDRCSAAHGTTIDEELTHKITMYKALDILGKLTGTYEG